jgi:hypothetical protein
MFRLDLTIFLVPLGSVAQEFLKISQVGGNVDDDDLVTGERHCGRKDLREVLPPRDRGVLLLQLDDGLWVVKQGCVTPFLIGQ